MRATNNGAWIIEASRGYYPYNFYTIFYTILFYRILYRIFVDIAIEFVVSIVFYTTFCYAVQNLLWVFCSDLGDGFRILEGVKKILTV